MEESSQEVKKKEQISEEVTFYVPFSVGDVKEDISITTNNPSKFAEDKIIDEALRLHSEGNIQEAGKC